MKSVSDGGAVGSTVDKVSLELAALVRPEHGAAISHQEIWNKVVDEGARLPGNWNATCAGACRAADCGDWTLCTYLAAQCFRREGKDALAAVDPECQRALWLEVVAPIVVDVPRGKERLRVRFNDCEEEWVSTDMLKDGPCGSHVSVKGRGRATFCRAEQFRVGGVVQPVKFKRIQLQDTELVEFQSLLQTERSSCPSCLDGSPMLLHIPGIWYHVMAYPLAGNITKALLRPRADAWTVAQRSALQRLAETLASKCAKAGKWEIVETLMRAGVPYPDLTREFNDACGSSDVVSSAWRQDLLAAFGRGRTSLLELAAWQPAPRRSVGQDDEEPSPLQSLMAALQRSGQHLDLGGGHGGRPLLVAAAEAERWDIVTELLQQTDVKVFTSALVKSRIFSEKAPARVRFLAEERARQDAMTQALAPSQTLRDYFLRHLSGQVVHSQVLPKGFESREGILKGRNGVLVLDWCLRLGPRPAKASGKSLPPGSELVFVSLSRSDLKEAAKMAQDPAISKLAVDLNQRTCYKNDPDIIADQNCWAAVLCHSSYLKKDCKGQFVLSVPANELTTPHILRTFPVEVTVVTPCCGVGLAGIAIYAAGQFANTTDNDGVAKFRLPIGKYVLTAPGHALSDCEVELRPDDYYGIEEQLTSAGELFVYMQDMSVDDKPKDGVMLCGDRSQIPEDAGRFIGTVSLPDGNGPGLRVRRNQKCSEALAGLRVNLEDGRRYKPNKDLTWFEDYEDECEVALLFSGTPIRLGDARGERPPAAQRDGNIGVPSPARPSTGSRPPKPGSPYVDQQLASFPDCWSKQITKGAVMSKSSRPPLAGSNADSQSRRRRPTHESRTSPSYPQRPSSAGPLRGALRMSDFPTQQDLSQRSSSLRPGSKWRSPSGSAVSSNPSSGQASPVRSIQASPRIGRQGSREQLTDRYNREPLPRPRSQSERGMRAGFGRPLRLSES